MMNTHRAEILIIGSGSAGYTAAIYAARQQEAAAARDRPSSLAANSPSRPTSRTTLGSPRRFRVNGLWSRCANRRNGHCPDLRYLIDLSERPFHAQGDLRQLPSLDALIIATGA